MDNPFTIIGVITVVILVFIGLLTIIAMIREVLDK
jgi:hypothetical protein